MYSLSDLTTEIEHVIETMEGEPRLHPDWIAQAVMQRHPCIEGEDREFYFMLARAHVRDQVRKRLNRYKAEPEIESDRQLVMEGFERLQKRYLIAEDGEWVAIRVQDMTRSQRLAKAHELRVMGAGCYQHARELERYDQMLATSKMETAT